MLSLPPPATASWPSASLPRRRRHHPLRSVNTPLHSLNTSNRFSCAVVSLTPNLLSTQSRGPSVVTSATSSPAKATDRCSAEKAVVPPTGRAWTSGDDDDNDPPPMSAPAIGHEDSAAEEVHLRRVHARIRHPVGTRRPPKEVRRGGSKRKAQQTGRSSGEMSWTGEQADEAEGEEGAVEAHRRQEELSSALRIVRGGGGSVRWT
ncbi:hypothetical protein GW17_00011495 [Ensete ventricosum]|nr:hypothetical protein GW17_00011495 [Ensete ventricosum]